MAVRLDTTGRNKILDSGLDAYNSAGIKIYNGTQPATGGGSHADTELASGTLPASAFAAASAGARAPASTWSLTVGTTGTAGWARITASGGGIIDMSVGQGTGDLSLDDSSLVSGGTVSVTGGTITLPAS